MFFLSITLLKPFIWLITEAICVISGHGISIASTIPRSACPAIIHLPKLFLIYFWPVTSFRTKFLLPKFLKKFYFQRMDDLTFGITLNTVRKAVDPRFLYMLLSYLYAIPNKFYLRQVPLRNNFAFILK